MRYLSQTGFSLIEPAIVSAVFCVFLVLALPAYLDLSEGTGISIGLQLSAPVREAVAEYAASHGGFPARYTSAPTPRPAQLSLPTGPLAVSRMVIHCC